MGNSIPMKGVLTKAEHAHTHHDTTILRLRLRERALASGIGLRPGSDLALLHQLTTLTKKFLTNFLFHEQNTQQLSEYSTVHKKRHRRSRREKTAPTAPVWNTNFLFALFCGVSAFGFSESG